MWIVSFPGVFSQFQQIVSLACPHAPVYMIRRNGSLRSVPARRVAGIQVVVYRILEFLDDILGVLQWFASTRSPCGGAVSD